MLVDLGREWEAFAVSLTAPLALPASIRAIPPRYADPLTADVP